MRKLFLLLGACALLGAAHPETRFTRVQTESLRDDFFMRSAAQKRAVVLVQGLRQHLWSGDQVPHSVMREWQEPKGKMAQALAREADVYAFAYGQDVALEEVIGCEGLRKGIRELKKAGYTQIVMVGHSAGGLISRHFVEDNPDAGVTKIIQLCAPNSGSPWGQLKWGVPSSQGTLLDSLSNQGRELYLQKRAGKKAPPEVQFVCVVGSGGNNGDGIVPLPSQWPDDLQEQGIPAVVLHVTHKEVVRDRNAVAKVVELVQKDQPRWSVTKVAAARRLVLFEGKDPSSQASVPIGREAYRLALETRAKEAEKNGDLQRMIECAFALYPLEQGRSREKARSAALLVAAADKILSMKDPAAAQHFLSLCQPILLSLPEKKLTAMRSLVLGKDAGKSVKDDASTVDQLVRKFGRDLVDSEAKPRGGVDRELAEYLGLAAFAQLYPVSALSDDPPKVEFKRTFPAPHEATLSITVRWDEIEAKIEARFLVKKTSADIVELTIQESGVVLPPDTRWLEQLKREINRKLREP